MNRHPKGIIAQVVNWNPGRPERVAETILNELRRQDWHLVSRPTVSVVPEEGDIFGYARGLEDVRIEGQLDGLIVQSRIKIHSQLPGAEVVRAEAAASRRYSYELGRLLGLPL